MNLDFEHMKKALIEDECGAVTVDWVVLTAAIVAMALAFSAPIFDAVHAKRDQIAASVLSAP